MYQIPHDNVREPLIKSVKENKPIKAMNLIYIFKTLPSINLTYMDIKNNIRDEDANTLLHLACDRKENENDGENYKDLVDCLIDNGASVNSYNVDDRIALHFTCINNNKKLTMALLEKNIKINTKDDYKKTPLDYALSHPDKKLVVALVHRGATYNHCSDSDKAEIKKKLIEASNKYLEKNTLTKLSLKNISAKTLNSLGIEEKSIIEDIKHRVEMNKGGKRKTMKRNNPKRKTRKH